MGGFAVAFGRLEEDAWARMVADLTLSSEETINEWRDHARGIRLARVAGKHAKPIAARHDCVVVARGAASEEKIADEHARSRSTFTREISGDFVFALYDVKRDRLIVACDVVGGRTASFFWNGEVLVVATRTLALLRHPAVPKKFDRVYRAHALTDFWSQAAGTTAFESIRRLRPGHALILKNGTLSERESDRLMLSDRKTKPLRGEHACAAFRNLLDIVVRERVEKNSCVALSGGLDSTTVASSIGRVFGSINAISIIDSKHPELDEHEAVDAFASTTTLSMCAIDAADDVPFDERADAFPIADDPATLSWAYVPTKHRLALRAKELGATAIVDGEGGDEIFDVCVRGAELNLAREPLAFFSYLRHKKNPARVLLDEMIAPRSEALSNFLAIHRKLDWFAPWLTTSFRNDSAARTARKEREKWLFLPPFVIAFPRTIEIAAAVGSNAAARLAREAVGLESISPLLDRRIIEFFAHLPAEEKVDGSTSKLFLRRASSSPAIANREKDSRLYDAIALRAFDSRAKRERLVELVTTSPASTEIDARQLRRGLSAIADDSASKGLVEQAAAVIQYAIWSRAVAHEYAVT